VGPNHGTLTVPYIYIAFATGAHELEADQVANKSKLTQQFGREDGLPKRYVERQP